MEWIPHISLIAELIPLKLSLYMIWNSPLACNLRGMIFQSNLVCEISPVGLHRRDCPESISWRVRCLQPNRDRHRHSNVVRDWSRAGLAWVCHCRYWPPCPHGDNDDLYARDRSLVAGSWQGWASEKVVAVASRTKCQNWEWDGWNTGES